MVLMREHIVEGTWEDVLSHADEFEGHRVRVIVLDAESEPARSDIGLSSNEIEKRLQAWEMFTSEPLSKEPPLSDYAVSRESFYEDEHL